MLDGVELVHDPNASVVVSHLIYGLFHLLHRAPGCLRRVEALLLSWRVLLEPFYLHCSIVAVHLHDRLLGRAERCLFGLTVVVRRHQSPLVNSEGRTLRLVG